MTASVSGPELSHEPQAPPARVPIVWISWLRVVAIIGVVAIHTVGYNAVAEDARDTFRGQLAIWIDVGAIFAVPIFVMISGALLLNPARYQGPGPFLRKRALRLVPPIIFWHLWYFAFQRYYLGFDLPAAEAFRLAMNGRLYTALYFFWIVAGLMVVAPILIPFVASVTRRGVVVAGTVAASMTVLLMATRIWREAPVVVVESALTWWIPYVGLFLLGYGLRGVVLRGVALWATTVAVFLLAWLQVATWRNPETPLWLAQTTPPSYYSLTTVLYAIGIFLVFQGMFDPHGPLRFVLVPWLNRVMGTLGDATLGVFALHLTVLMVLLEYAPVVGGEREAARALFLVLRVIAVVAVTYAIVLPLRRVPIVRSVL